MESTMQKVGKWAFIIGVCLALVLGIITSAASVGWISGVLVVLGLIVGFLNVTGAESRDFLLAAVSLVIIAYMGGDSLASIPAIGPRLEIVFNSLLTFVVPAALIVALKAIWSVARDE